MDILELIRHMRCIRPFEKHSTIRQRPAKRLDKGFMVNGIKRLLILNGADPKSFEKLDRQVEKLMVPTNFDPILNRLLNDSSFTSGEFIKLANKRKNRFNSFGLFTLETITEVAKPILVVNGAKVNLRSVSEDTIVEFKSACNNIDSIPQGYYHFQLDQDTLLDTRGERFKRMRINHSCEPNCFLKQVTIKKQDETNAYEFKLVLYSSKPIEANEELTIDYNLKIYDYLAKFDCQCKAKSCRKFI